MATYPYYIIPDIEALPEASGEERLRLSRRIAAIIGDPIALKNILGFMPEEFVEFYPELLKSDSPTDMPAASFIDKCTKEREEREKKAEPVAETDELVPLPPLDYDLDLIECDPIDDTPTDEEDRSSAEIPVISLESEEKKPAPPVLSESLARAMIKNGNYRKALEIITDLSLKNPKKSIYFADQIRFLKKLILNQSNNTDQN